MRKHNPCVKHGDKALNDYRKGMRDTLLVLIAIFADENYRALPELSQELEMVRQFRQVVTDIYDSSLFALKCKSNYKNTLNENLMKCSFLLKNMRKFKKVIPMVEELLYKPSRHEHN